VHVRASTLAAAAGSPLLHELARHAALACAVVLVSSAPHGGYAYFERLGWIDAFLNSAMLLAAWPGGRAEDTGWQAVRGCYALYAGLVFLVTGSILLAPVVHRLFHRFHLEELNR